MKNKKLVVSLISTFASLLLVVLVGVGVYFGMNVSKGNRGGSTNSPITVPDEDKGQKDEEHDTIYEAAFDFDYDSYYDTYKIVNWKSASSKNVKIPATYLGKRVTKMSESLFESSSILALSFENGCNITELPSKFCMNCTELKSVVLPESIVEIGSSAFKGCTALENIDLPTSVTEIGALAFESCSVLSGIEFPENATVIAAGSFRSTALTQIVIPSSITTIGESAFMNCKDLSKIDFEEGSLLTSIGKKVFEGCSGLKGIIIPSSVTSIGWSSFYGCSSLTSIAIPSQLTSIGSYAFSGCSGIENITVESGNASYHSNGNCLIETSSKTLILGCKNSVIPTDGSVTTIGVSAFSYCNGLTSITIPSNVTSIGDSAFLNCTNLRAVVFEDESQLTSIGASAFHCCGDLSTIIIPSSVTSIGSSPFFKCSKLTSVTMPAFITNQDMVFYACTSITNLILVPGVECVDKGTSIGKYLPNKIGLTFIEIAEGITGIGDAAFSGCDCVTELIIPSSITNIGESAFYGCSGLTKVIFKENSNLTSIERQAFSSCSSLSILSLPVAVTNNSTIDSNYNCTSLTTLNLVSSAEGIPNGTTIGPYLPNKNELTNVTVPSSVTSIGKAAFAGCFRLQAVVFGDESQLTSIDVRAFNDCYNLVSITIRASVTSIGSYAFSGCTSLTITMESVTPPTISHSYSAFDSVVAIYVPSSALEAYKAADGWRDYADKIFGI